LKREAKLLLQKAIDALILSVEHFNGSRERGRVSAVLILLDHSFEMLLKASIIQRGGDIREDSKHTIGFDKCIRIGISDARCKFLSTDQAIALQTINGCRDSAQHYLLEISEQQLYIHAQSGVTLFRDLLDSVFGMKLISHLPARVLPISTIPPQDLIALFESEIDQIAKMIKPGRRKQVEAIAKLRPLAILNASVQGEKYQPGEEDLKSIAKAIGEGKSWRDIFPGAASIEFTTEGTGTAINLRITKKEGLGFHLVKEGTPGASVVAVKRVGDLDFYSLDYDNLRAKVGLSKYQLTCISWALNLKDDEEMCKKITFGRSQFFRYSQKAVDSIQTELKKKAIDEICEEYQAARA
jgi:hypothetical protein